MNKGHLASSVYHFFLYLSGGAGSPLLLLFIGLLFVSLRSHLSDAEGGPVCRNSIPYVFLWIWLLFPILVVVADSLHQPIFQPRYLIICLPPFLILAADGMAHIRSRPILIAAFIVTAGMSLRGVTSYYEAYANMNYVDNWRDATAYCLSQAEPGDAVLFTNSTEEIPFREYEDRFAGARADIRLVPQKTDVQLLSTPASWTSPELASSAAHDSRRLWVITAFQPNAHSIAIDTALRLHLSEQSRRNFGFVVVKVFGVPNT
jgi:4-amino-4-deoxy-L-arabinose transferase-like glycosyltransferase